MIDPLALIKDYGVDAVRYFLLREVPFGQDGDFSAQQFATRYQSELANNYGNLVQRVLSFIVKNQILPIQHNDLLAECGLATIQGHMDNLAFNRALEQIWAWMSEANQYMDHSKPWALRKEDPEACAKALYTLVERIRQLSIIVQPFLPNAALHVLNMLKVGDTSFQSLQNIWEPCIPESLPTPLFPPKQVE